MLTLFYGPMFSGKTTMLLELEHMYHNSNKTVCCFKYKHDTRYTDENKIISHNGQQNHVKSHVVSTDLLIPFLSTAITFDIVVIDECQFFKDCVEFVKTLLKCSDKKTLHILCSGLSGDFKQEPFQVVSNLIPLSNKITHLTSVCYICSKDASFTIRTSKDQEQELIGGDQLYKPICHDCLWSNKN